MITEPESRPRADMLKLPGTWWRLSARSLGRSIRKTPIMENEQMKKASDDKWVRVMCDFEAEGLWRKDGAEVAMDEIPISIEVKRRLAAWQDWFERDYENYLPPSQRTKSFDFDAFSREGLEIAKAIKTELPEWTVVYFDEARSRAWVRTTDENARPFEYEIVP